MSPQTPASPAPQRVKTFQSAAVQADESHALPRRENENIPQQNTNRGLNFQGLWRLGGPSAASRTSPAGSASPRRSAPTHVPAESGSRGGAATRRPPAPAARLFPPPRPREYTRGPASKAPLQQPYRPGRKPPPPRRTRTPGRWAVPGRQPIGGRRPTSLMLIGCAGEKAVPARSRWPQPGRRRGGRALR